MQITLPTLHAGQVRIAQDPCRRKAVLCGRRWGKTVALVALAADAMIRGKNVGIFTPQYKFQSEIYHELLLILQVMRPVASKNDGVIRLPQTGGRCDFWSLENPAAGRGRKYHLCLIDEAGFAKAGPDGMEAIWSRAIEPTLLDFSGSCIAFSTPNGTDPDNWFWSICQEGSGWRKFKSPSKTNPYLPLAELDRLKETMHPMAYQQEFEAKWVDWSGVAFFRLPDLLNADEQPYPVPEKIYGAVFAVMDTSVKSGQQHDSSAVIYCATQPAYMNGGRTMLFILDWDVRQIDGGVLIDWFPQINQRLEELARMTLASAGNVGAFIEDRVSGSILIQQALKAGLLARPIESKLTQMGKDERAIAASPYYSGRQIAITKPAHDKTLNLKGATRNHLLHQLTTFRLADKDAYKRADDLLDVAMYAAILSLGNAQGF